jgi:hypothetical protein
MATIDYGKNFKHWFDGDRNDGTSNYWIYNPHLPNGNPDSSTFKRNTILIVQYEDFSGANGTMETPTTEVLQENMDNDMGIVGLMTSKVTYSLSADWKANEGIISKMVTAFDGAANSLFPANMNFNAAGYSTRKFYSGGTDLKLTVNMRIYDAQPDYYSNGRKSYLKTQLEKLKLLVVPKNIPNASIMADDENELFESARGIAENLQDKIDDLNAPAPALETPGFTGAGTESDATNTPVTAPSIYPTTATNPGDEEEGPSSIDQALTGIGNAASALGESGKALVSNYIDGAVDTLGSLSIIPTTAPKPVFVSIGGWFQLTDAVVESVQFAYSDAMGVNGPLYVDVDISFTTRENISVNDASSTESNLAAETLFRGIDFMNDIPFVKSDRDRILGGRRA